MACSSRVIESRGAFAGLVGLYPHDASGGLELAYFLQSHFWGRGLAKRAARAIVDEIFPHHAAPGIWARAAEDNPASLRVLAGLGCEPVGTLEKFFVSRGATVTSRLFWLDRRHLSRDWTAVETPRLCLTPPCAADLDRIVELAGDREIAVQTARIPHPYTRARRGLLPQLDRRRRADLRGTQQGRARRADRLRRLPAA